MSRKWEKKGCEKFPHAKLPIEASVLRSSTQFQENLMKKIVSALVCATALLAFSAAAQAATANFQGSCSTVGTSVTCTFDELRPSGSPSSCPGSYIYFSSWNFGD